MIHLSHHESDWFAHLDRAGHPIRDTASQACLAKQSLRTVTTLIWCP
jgi:lambda repressor-like predicted transcriptional regulator